MKINKYIQGTVLALTMLMVSCTDFVEPNIPYRDFNTGAYLRTIQRTSTTFTYQDIEDFFDVQNSIFALTLEAVDAENGGTVESVEIRVRHRRFTGAGFDYIPALSSEDPIVRTLTPSDFAPNDESRFLRTSISIPASEALSVLGVAATDIERGDVFEFRLVLVDRMGRRFTNTNLSPDVQGGLFYDSPFLYTVPVVCPSNLAGTFTYRTVNPVPAAAACLPSISGEVTFTSTGIGQYSISDVSFGIFDCAYSDTPPAGSVRFRDTCGALEFTGTDRYGDSYDMEVISNDGTNLTFNWTNTWGDGGTTTLTAPEGFWPLNLRSN